MSYIYEMDVAHLRICYVLPPGLTCFTIETVMYNWNPYDRSKLEMKYQCSIMDIHFTGECQYHKTFENHSLQALTEEIRKYYILNPYKQSLVEKSPEDGTESVITTS